ncbi:ubiquitin-related domain-containing protein, partial [Dichomitus squalens]
SGRTLAIWAHTCDTVGYVKDRLFEQLGIPVQYQRMVYAGKELVNDRTLSDYNVRSESTLHCALRPVPIVLNLPSATCLPFSLTSDL